MVIHQLMGMALLLVLMFRSKQTGNTWHQTGLENGGTDCEDPPGTREADGCTKCI